MMDRFIVFFNNFVSYLLPVGEKLLVVGFGLVLCFISDLDGNMKIMLIILINVTNLGKVF